MHPSPYETPNVPPIAAEIVNPYVKTPAVWKWYVAYCVFMSLLYLACFVAGIAMLFFADDIASADVEVGSKPMDAWIFKIQGIVFAVLGAALCIFFTVATLLPRRKAAWIVGILAIGLGCTSPCCLPVAAPILIYWVKPETRLYFNA